MSGRAYRHASATAGLCRLEHNLVFLPDATLALVSCKLAFRRESRIVAGLEFSRRFRMLGMLEDGTENTRSPYMYPRQQESCCLAIPNVDTACSEHGWERKEAREDRPWDIWRRAAGRDCGLG